MRLRTSFACGVILCSLAATPVAAVEPDAPEQLITRLDAVGYEVMKRLEAGFHAKTDYIKNEHGALVEYYSDHDNRPVWVDTGGLTDKARAIMQEIAKAGDYGLNAADYALPELERAAEGEQLPLAKLADAEVMISHAALAYVRDARGGRIPPRTLSRNLDPTLDIPDPLKVMEEIVETDDPAAFLRGFQPQHPQFEALRQVLLRTRGGSATEKRIAVPKGPVIKPGESHKQVAIIRKRLKVDVPERDGRTLFPEQVFDSELEMAVKAFQKSHGLTADGVIGPATRRAMNARPKNKVKTILANMERWRWIPVEDKLHVRVNVPEFLVRVHDGEKIIHSERVVVGKLKNSTPVFSGEMDRIVFNPYWNVPNSIKVEEILPYLRRGGGGWFFSSSSRPAVLRRHNLYVKYRGRSVDASSVDWRRVDIRKFHFYQPPGGPNVLGVVKFMFPNKHDVYMHDTPTKELFVRSSRAYSHGCVRVRNPLKIAELLLSRDSGWSRGRINATVRSGKNSPVKLNNKVPVHVTYFTARARADGSVVYFGDLYGHDTRIARALKF